MQTFSVGSPLHIGMLAALAALIAAAIVLRRHADAVHAAIFESAVGALYVMSWVGTFVWLRTQSSFDPATDRPLQLCHWTGIAAALALIAPGRAFSALAYFWGLALCTQALATPSLREGPATWPFWFFWSTHALCVGVPIYEVLARGYRPQWRHYVLACGAAALYVAIVLPVDIATGWNYGFVGPTRPGFRTLVDMLGPWPLRLLWIALIAAGAMALLMLPWRATRIQAQSPPMHPG